MRCSGVRLTQAVLVCMIFGAIYMKIAQPGGDDTQELADPFPHHDIHEPNQELIKKVAEVQAAEIKRQAQEVEDERKQKRIVQKAKLEEERKSKAPAKRLPKVYPDVKAPDAWINGDWTGMDADAQRMASEDQMRTASVAKYAFNAHRSAKVPLRRPLRDMRSAACKAQMYDAVESLPTVSVVICFAEEMWSSLFRTVWSVIDRTPKNLLREIILYNDASVEGWLQKDLDDYMKHMPKVVKLIKSTKREGLIRARTNGAKHADGDIIVFLDSHCEASDGWYEPIAQRIKESRNTIICPTIDSISDQSIEYNGGGGMAVGGFHWTLDFTWIYRPLEPGKTQADPMLSPTMAGGLFAVNREYWYELGSYDLQMGGWGGENLELSFRVWQCGGSMEIHPCSHVGHIFRSQHPYAVPGGFGEVYLRNSARLAAGWMDEYADIYFRIRPSAKKTNYGDVTERLELRKKLDCKPFKYFLDKFFKDKFIPTAEVTAAEGQLKNGENQCIDKMGHQHVGETLGTYGCHGMETPSLNQAFLLTKSGQIRTMWDLCFDSRERSASAPVRLAGCHSEQVWDYDKTTKRLTHSKSGKCMDVRGSQIVINDCNGQPAQQWTFSGQLNA